MAGIKFRRRSCIKMNIPTGPMADISFLLIIFFMVTTVFVVFRGFHVDLPRAERIDTLKSRRHIVSIWVDPTERIMVDEFNTDLSGVAGIVSEKLSNNPRIIILIKSDRNTPYRLISGIIEELKKANALRVSFVALKEQ